jgi:AcrR family transcriptional regulator
MDELAAEAGMTKPILYAHFGDKAGLAAAVADRYLMELVPAVLAAFGTGPEPKRMVRTAIDNFIEFVERDPQIYRFLVRGVAALDRSFIEQRLVTELGLRIAQVLRGGLRAAGSDTGPAELWSFAILGTVLAGAEWWQARPTMSRADLVDYLTDLVWGGLGAGGIDRLDAAAAFVTPDTGGNTSQTDAK